MQGRFAIVVFALCGVIAACHSREDTKSEGGWGVRPLEARLTGYPRYAPVAALRPRDPGSRDCEADTRTAAEAVTMLVQRAACTDAAVELLEVIAQDDRRALSDLSAAYLTRGTPRDDLAALRAAEQALVAMPDAQAARFNRALALERLGMTSEAIRAWAEVRGAERDEGWRSEAVSHREKLVSADIFNAETEWARAQPSLLRPSSVASVEKIVRTFPSLVEETLFNQMLPQWADDPTPERLANARTVAVALAQVTGDPYALQVVDACKPTDGIRKALRLYHAASEELFAWEKNRVRLDEATKAIGDHPFRLRIAIALAVSLSFKPDSGPTEALALLKGVERDVQPHPFLFALLRATQGYCLHSASQYAQSIEAYKTALATYESIRDREYVVRIQSRIAGSYKTAGQSELAWDWARRALPDLHRCVRRNSRVVALGEAADAAAALGFPQAALTYQQRNLQELGTPQARLIAYLKLASLHLSLDRRADARADLAEAERLLPNTSPDDANRRALTSRLRELQGRAADDPAAALALFNDALTLTRADELHTFRASVLAQIGDTYARMGQQAQATTARQSALDELRAEQRKNLAERKPGDAEDLWSAYFARFQSTVEKQIRHYADAQDVAAAFAQAEQARASEPLNLLLQRANVSDAFRKLTRGGDSVDLATIRQKLPPDTFLLEYAVFDNDTFVWIVSRDHDVQFRVLPVRRTSIERWSNRLQEAAVHHDQNLFQAILQASYDGLMREPMRVVRTLSNAPRRLVFVPDGAMHGLPFTALYDADAKRYLTQMAPIEITPSATLYVHALDRDRDWKQSTEPLVLLVGDPAFDASRPEAKDMDRLSGALDEVQRIGEVYGNRAKSLKEANATISKFLESARNSAVVHFAGHAVPDRIAPQHSYLLLAPSPNDDGVLDAQELLTRLSLDRARLVVLSACSSAGGAPVGAEGVSPLVRPLITAGVPAVIGSLWDVDDATAVTPLVSFHRHYEQGEDAAVAMQHMQLEMLRKDTAQFKSTLAWAPFQVIGHASSPFRPAPQSKEISSVHVPRTHSLQRSDGVRPQ